MRCLIYKTKQVSSGDDLLGDDYHSPYIITNQLKHGWKLNRDHEDQLICMYKIKKKTNEFNDLPSCLPLLRLSLIKSKVLH